MSDMSKKKIAVTGTIGSGKSTVTQLLSQYYPTESSDRLVSALYQNKDFVKKVNALVLGIESDVLDKQLIADKVFTDAHVKEKLEAFIHPLVKEKVIEFMTKHKDSVVEVPLLFEAGFDDLFDVIIAVVADEAISKKRLVENRGFHIEDVEARMREQFSAEEKAKRAHYVIINDGSLKDLEQNVMNIVKEIKEGD